MRRPGWDARRRNKNIGTAKSGRGQNNQMRIPEHWMGGNYILSYEKLENSVAIERTVGSRKITFLVEPVQAGFLHACTPDDIVRVLELLPPEHAQGIDLIVLRQPKRKERILEPVWGRLQYRSQIQQYTGVAIHLEAQPIDRVQRWRKSLSPEDIQELDRLVRDGHQVISERRYYAIYTNLESIRATQLYRTLPHEIGHYVDYLNSVKDTGDNDLFWSKPSKDKEAFAHRYATEFWEREKVSGCIPFDRILNEEKLITEGLMLSWFISEKTLLPNIINSSL
jgi:hypothetical protein